MKRLAELGPLAQLAYETDPTLIMEASGTPPDAWQARVLRMRPARLLLNCTRQAGKSRTVAAMAVDELLRGPALVLSVCPSERQSKLLIATVREIYEEIDTKLNDARQSTTHLELPNGAEMWALPSKEGNIRGFSAVSLLIIDEAARVPDDLYRAVRPMLAVSGGRLAVLSTPYGKRGFFFEAWTKGEGWERVRITAKECPRITPEFLAEEKRTLPDNWFQQEYMCEFADTEGAVFAYEDIQTALQSEAHPLFDAPVFQSESEALVI